MPDNFIPWDKLKTKIDKYENADFFLNFLKAQLPQGFEIPKGGASESLMKDKGALRFVHSIMATPNISREVSANLDQLYQSFQTTVSSFRASLQAPTATRYPTGVAAPQQAAEFLAPPTRGGDNAQWIYQNNLNYLTELRGVLEDQVTNFATYYTKYYSEETDTYIDDMGEEHTPADFQQIVLEETQAQLVQATQIIKEGGIGDPRLREGNFAYNTLVVPHLTEFTQFMSTKSTDISAYGGKLEGANVHSVAGEFYDSSSGARLGAQWQDYYGKLVQQAEQSRANMREANLLIAQEGEKSRKELQEYFDLQEQWAAPETQAHRSVLLRGEPHGRTAYDTIIAKDAAEARRLGYTSFVPEAVWKSPGVQAVVESTLLKNLGTQLQRLGLWRMEKTGTKTVQAKGATGMVKREGFPKWKKLPIEFTGIAPDLGEIASGRAPGFWDRVAKLSDAERDVAQQLARKAGMEAAGGEQAAGIQVRSERSPFGELVMTPEEWRSSTTRRVQGQIASATAARKRRIREELAQSYQEFVGGKMDGGRGREAPAGYVLGDEKTPAWMSQYVPGLEAGKPLRLGHQFPGLSQQQLLQMPPSQRAYMQQYSDVSRQVLGDIPMKPWEDVLFQMRVGRSQAGTLRTKWAPKRQRA